MNRICITIVFLLTLHSYLHAEVRLPALFSGGMVLQQQSRVEIWGWAEAGETVTMSCSWCRTSSTTLANDAGKWTIVTQTPAAGGPYTIEIKGKNKIEIKDILIGEVWLCSGQSNMGFALKSAYRASKEIAKADFPTIRYFSVKRQYGPNPFEDAPGSTWVAASPATAGSFSAVAYYFARKLQKELKVPVGIIFAAWGGTPAEAWTPAITLRNDSQLKAYPERWEGIAARVGEDSVRYHQELTDWEKQKQADDGIKTKRPQEPWTLISYNRPWREPAVLFNGMIHPITRYRIKGFLWYQGESNVNFASEYVRLFSSLIESWREYWKDQSLPFYFVQIAPFEYANMDAAARLQWAQSQVAQSISNTAMAATIDVGNMKDQHPVHKKEVGERLAAIALNQSYGKKQVKFASPIIQSATRNGNAVDLLFDQPLISLHGDSSTAFELAYRRGAELIYVPAQATIEGRKVHVTSVVAEPPVEVRYAWLRIADADLSGKDGFPLTIFTKNIHE